VSTDFVIDGDEPDALGVREVKSAARTTDVLELLAAKSGETLKLREIAAALNAPKSSTYALLRTLIGRQWVQTDASGNVYSLGIRALLVGTSFIDADPHVRAVTPALARLAENLDETVHMARLDGENVVYLATQESHQYLRAYSRVGRRLPAFATSLGKAILAERDPVEIPDTLVALTPRTITDRNVLLKDLERVRELGYAIDNEENSLGLRCFGIALHYTSKVNDAISCSVPIARLTPPRERQIIEALFDARRSIEAIAPDPNRF
jgi:DNA-binding IclR family transcriptional regulator